MMPDPAPVVRRGPEARDDAARIARAWDPEEVADARGFARRAGRNPGSTVLVAGAGSGAVGAALGPILAWNEPSGRWLSLWIPAGLHATAQARALWREIVAHGAGHGVSHLRMQMPVDRGADMAYLAARGFVEIERSQRVSLRIDVEPPPVVAPEGLELITLAARPELFGQILEVDREAIPDIPGDGADVPSAAYWRARLDDGTYRASTTVFVVDEDGRALAYAVLHHHAGRDDVADHDFTATRRDARGRGLAALVKRAQARAAWAEGVRVLRAYNHLDNAAMRAVNDALGYIRASDTASLRWDRPPA